MKTVRNLLALALALALGVVMISAVQSWPEAALANAPLRMHVTPRYLEKCADESGRTQPASAVRWDYRSWDLWFWVFASAVAATALARRGGSKGAKTWVGGAALIGLCLGVLPVFGGGVFLDYESLPAWGDTAYLRIFGSVLMEVVVFVTLTALVFVLLSASRGSDKDGTS